jgi:Flp pilus assembly pilin Flp
MRRTLRTFSKSEDGQAIVELALVLPVLLLILVGIVELGHAVNTWNNDTDIANVAARYAVVGKLPSSGACASGSFDAFIKCEAEKDGVPTPISSCVSVPVAKVGEPVEVKVYSKYKWIGLLGFSSPESSVTGRATMRLEQIPPEYQSGKCA